MTEVTLHRASRIDQEIRGAIAQIETPRTEEVSVFSDAEKATSEIADRVSNNIDRLQTLMNIRGRLREAIGQRNTEVGVNRLLARKHALDQQIQLLHDHVRDGGRVRVRRAMEPEDVVKEIPQRRERVQNTDAPVEDVVTVRTLGSGTRTEIADQLLELRRELETVTEELRQLNNSKTIEIADKDLEVLQRERIV